MKNFITIIFAIAFIATTDAQISKSNIGSKSITVKSEQVNLGVKLLNINQIKSTDLKKLKIPTASISSAQRNAKTLNSWKIIPLKPKYSSLELVRHNGEYSPQGWTLNPEPIFEGTDFKGYNISTTQVKFRVTNGERYNIIIKLKDVSNNWYEGKSILAAALNNTFSKYPIDAVNKELVIPFTANNSGNKIIHIGNVVFNDQLFSYTIKSIQISKIQY
ncbi:hypothetical protein [Polaribacter sp.]|uniref:hypothetical protein n=1 Tax=Polaribacter sp. TaxID=1920175 RepID=UPI003EF2867F